MDGEDDDDNEEEEEDGEEEDEEGEEEDPCAALAATACVSHCHLKSNVTVYYYLSKGLLTSMVGNGRPLMP